MPFHFKEYMVKDSFFLVIEGLDGSGKTSIGRHLARFCEEQLSKKVRLTYEPHDPSAGGLFIRQILKKKITDFTPETLMVAFAANRLDHKNRVLNDWLDRGADHMIICDRNYLSSLVYQTNVDFSKAHVMALNQNARQPDLTIFMNVSNEVCYQRMKHRNKPQELFETNLSNTREKYLSAIDFLKKERNEKIVTVDANGTMEEVLKDVIKLLKETAPDYFNVDSTKLKEYVIPTMTPFSLEGTQRITLSSLLNEAKKSDQGEVHSYIANRFQKLEKNDKGFLFFDYLRILGFKIIERFSTTNHPVFKLEYLLPTGIQQTGMLIIMEAYDQSNMILETVSNLEEMTDFMFVFAMGQSNSMTPSYERDKVEYNNKITILFPAAKIFTEDVLIQELQQLFLNSTSASKS